MATLLHKGYATRFHFWGRALYLLASTETQSLPRLVHFDGMAPSSVQQECLQIEGVCLQ
ncbi:hypothetical protein AFERRI_240005 [Acidithiobacillus ferrivorans]|uniref:Uncharacterized protein n=1 Tax=Acidithiobacillus ferrivorans TaxID=160808 RepID=A0A060ULE1_9PROT|nr:hypothetical protein AFERRI_240005 [Acidithiobacillus ferrivorans]